MDFNIGDIFEWKDTGNIYRVLDKNCYVPKDGYQKYVPYIIEGFYGPSYYKRTSRRIEWDGTPKESQIKRISEEELLQIIMEN